MNEGANCFAPEIIQAGFSMFPCWVDKEQKNPGNLIKINAQFLMRATPPQVFYRGSTSVK